MTILQDFINENRAKMGDLNSDPEFKEVLSKQINIASGQDISSATYYTYSLFAHIILDNDITSANNDLIETIMSKTDLDFNTRVTFAECAVWHPLTVAISNGPFALAERIINYPGFDPNSQVHLASGCCPEEYVFENSLEFILHNKIPGWHILAETLINQHVNITEKVLGNVLALRSYLDEGNHIADLIESNQGTAAILGNENPNGTDA